LNSFGFLGMLEASSPLGSTTLIASPSLSVVELKHRPET
jgi:hypothetical protein